MLDPGLYIVTLTNEEAISVNANDPRIAHRCIRVSRLNCKFGKAKHLARRRDDYRKVFGAGNVVFRPIALMDQIDAAERLVLRALGAWRIRGNTGRRNEWLVGIESADVERIALDVLRSSGLAFEPPDHWHDAGSARSTARAIAGASMSSTHRLFVYGTLAPGKPNEHVLAGIPGQWEPASVRGRLLQEGWGAAAGFPGIILDPHGDEVQGLIFSAQTLDQHWGRLDDFEGDGYVRRPASATRADGSTVDVHVYALNPSSLGPAAG
jgi:gamma-glutamylcyclotransferase (GGCT)/AIG2-like uncharacterized protein YtfP